MSTTAYAWAPITKVEDQDDGTVMVYGPATDAGVDRDKQRLNQAWLDTAMPAWQAEGGNVREQHQPTRAVGVAVGMTRDSDGVFNLAAHVVDPVAVKKVQTKVLKGFSVGIKDPQISFGKADAPNGEIIGGSIIEVSLVDRPANPRTLFTMVKADAAGQLEGVDDPAVVEDPDAEPDSDPDGGGATEPAPNAEKAEQILAELRALVPAALTKADTVDDITEASTAIACIGRLIASEATSMGAGQYGDADQIACLLDAVRALKYFIACEQAETAATPSEVADSMSMSGGAYMADEMKTEDTATEAPADTPDLTKADMSGLPDIVKAAVAEATNPLKDELELVKADLAKALAMPAAGGPAATRTASQAQAARDQDAANLRAQAAELLAKADARRQEDPTLAMGYRERAAALLEKADA